MITKSAERRILISLIVVSGVLLFLRATNTVFLYPMILISMAALAICPFKVCLPYLFFLLPSANIIKIQAGQISLFTVLFLIFIVRVLLKNGRLDRIFLLGILTFGVYCFILAGTEKIITIATMICGFAMLHDACDSDEYSYEDVLCAFCAGILLASVLGLLKDSFPLLKSFIVEVEQKLSAGEYTERFVGLQRNPNYYTMDITVALSCLVSNMSSDRPKIKQMIIYGVLSVFGIMSISKSFLLIWVILVLLLLLCSIKTGGGTFVKLILAMVITGAALYYFAGESINAYMVRLDTGEAESVSEMTTGRTDIWLTYIKAAISDNKNLFFGNGIGKDMKNYKAMHSTYIELIYSLGIVGIIVYLFALKTSVTIKNFPKRVVCYIPVFALLVRFIGIGMLTQDSVWYYFVLVCLLLKNEYQKEASIQVLTSQTKNNS